MVRVRGTVIGTEATHTVKPVYLWRGDDDFPDATFPRQPEHFTYQFYTVLILKTDSLDKIRCRLSPALSAAQVALLRAEPIVVQGELQRAQGEVPFGLHRCALSSSLP